MSTAVDAARALVVGVGLSGTAAAKYLATMGVEVVACDDGRGDAVVRRAEELLEFGVDVRLGLGIAGSGAGPAAAPLDDLLAGTDLVVASPGVPPGHPVLESAAAAGVRVWSEVELAARVAEADLVAVTGTNGKTTVTTAIGAVLGDAGMPVATCGNIGTPMIEAAAALSGDAVLVVEVSSFQLALTDAFRARVGVLLNVAEDHLDWHTSMEAYVAAKSRVWANQDGEDLSVGWADDATVTGLLAAAGGRHALFSAGAPGPAGAGYERGRLVVKGSSYGDADVMAAAELADRSPHGLANAAAVACVCADLGVFPDSLAASLAAFRPPAHRLEDLGVWQGIRFVDDSKATNPAAALAALAAFDHVVLIAGGRNKGLDLGVLAEAADRIEAIVAIGDAAAEIAAAFAETGIPVEIATSMHDAVDMALEAAKEGDVVLLSPACASFDWYSGYSERGRHFAAVVAQRTGLDTGVQP